MLKIMNAIEDTVDKYSDEYRFINDHELNVVCQIDTDEERIEFILAAIDEQLPAGIVFSHEYTCGEYEITFKEIKGDDIMISQVRDIVRKYLNIEIIGYTEDPKHNMITLDLYDFLDKPGNFESDIKDAINEIKTLLPNHTVEAKFYNDNYWNGEEMEDTYNCILGIIGGEL